jgi:hypothetical protein
LTFAEREDFEEPAEDRLSPAAFLRLYAPSARRRQGESMAVYLLRQKRAHPSRFEEGDVADTSCYRGTGSWYYDGHVFIKTSGEYGYFLPKEAWPMIVRHGSEFFDRCGCDYVLLPPGAEVDPTNIVSDNAPEALQPFVVREDREFGVCIRTGAGSDERLIVDGKPYDTPLTTFY